MNVIGKSLELGKVSYYIKHLDIIDAFLPYSLTKREREVLGNFMAIGSDYVFDKESRKVVMDRCGLDFGGLSNYIRSLRRKGVLRKDGGRYVIMDYVIPNSDYQGYKFKIVNKG